MGSHVGNESNGNEWSNHRSNEHGNNGIDGHNSMYREHEYVTRVESRAFSRN